jgi:rsbT antagonist protein RsbS
VNAREEGRMKPPILKLNDKYIVSVQSTASDHDLLHLQTELIELAGASITGGVVVDVAALDVIDSFACRTLRNLCQALRLRGARAVITGISPATAFAMVQLGLSLRDVTIKRDLDEGCAFLEEKPAQGGNDDGRRLHSR